jgi:hypothetical protein
VYIDKEHATCGVSSIDELVMIVRGTGVVRKTKTR